MNSTSPVDASWASLLLPLTQGSTYWAPCIVEGAQGAERLGRAHVGSLVHGLATEATVSAASDNEYLNRIVER
jgi:hypothetical protein